MKENSIRVSALLLCFIVPILFSKIAMSGCISVGSNPCDFAPISDPVTGGTVPIIQPGPITISPIPELEMQATLTFTAPSAIVAASNWNAGIDQYPADINNSTATFSEWIACRYTLQCGLGTLTVIDSPWNSGSSRN